MKKQYITPATECVEMEAQALCAASELSTDGNGGSSPIFGDGATGDALGKGHINVWGDDEEDE